MGESLAILGGEKTRKKPFPPHPVFGDEEKRAVLEALEAGAWSGFIAQAGEFFLGGPRVKELEQLFRDQFVVTHAVASNSATSSLHSAVAASGAGPGDEIIVPCTTMAATATAVVMNNSVPVFSDIEDQTFGLDPKSVESRISPRTKGMIVVHLFGHAARVKELMAIAKRKNLFVIEDCAQSPLATYDNQLVGTFGSCGVFSFNQHKTVTTGEGGVAITSDPRVALMLQLVRNHGEAVVSAMGIEEIENTLGWNYRMIEMVAALGITQFRRLEKLTKVRERHAERLTELLSTWEGITLPERKAACRHVYFQFPFRIHAETFGLSRDRFADALIAEGIPMGKGYVRPLYLEPMFQRKLAYGRDGCPFECPIYLKRGGKVSYPKGLCPTAERLHFKELAVTSICRAPLSDEDFDDVLAAFKKVYEHRHRLAKE